MKKIFTNTQFTNFKKKMAKKAIENGIYEDFGQKEIRELKDKYPHLNLGDPTEKHNARQFAFLEDWCMIFDYEQMENWRKFLNYK